MPNHYIADSEWNAVADRLIEAAKHPADPATEVQIVLASLGVLPVSCREDVEAHAAHTD